MKTVLIFATFIVVFGCGIMNLIFDLPERYIERDVRVDEMLGAWSVTPHSEADVNNFIKNNPNSTVSAPWKAFTLNLDGSCDMKLEPGWLGGFNSDLATKSLSSCSWSLAKEKNLSGKISPVLDLMLEYTNSYSAAFSLYIFEENGKLIVWDFIGDPDDFLPQDFAKVNR